MDSRARAQVLGALLLAVSAGVVDAVSFMVLHQTFTANMTGNSTELGIAAGLTNLHDLVPLLVAVCTFIGSIAAGTGGIELASRRGLRSAAVPVLLAEAVLIGTFMVAGHFVLRRGSAPDHGTGFYLLLTVAVVAMGFQTASLTKALGKTIRTTYVSGLITTFSQEIVNLLVPLGAGRASYLRDELGLGTRGESLRRVGFHVGVWVSFVGGAVWGGYGVVRWSTWALALPLGAVLGAGVVDLRRPMHPHTGAAS